MIITNTAIAVVITACTLHTTRIDQGLAVCVYACDLGPKTAVTIVSRNLQRTCEAHIQVSRWNRNP
jgi:hypothetical protein